MPKAIQINAKDNVAVVPQSVEAGQQVQVVETGAVVTATEFVKAGHKIALQDFHTGDTVVKYGIPIGVMKADCPKGGWIHCHNVEDTTGELCANYCQAYREAAKKETGDRKQVKKQESVEKKPSRMIQAYPRSNGSFGINNYLMVLPIAQRQAG